MKMVNRLFIMFVCALLATGALAQGQRGQRGQQAQRPPVERYTLQQAMGDRAQLHTIAFSGLAFITGEFGASTFIPPGKVCDYFGFQYMRDIDAAEKGHNPLFLNRVVGNVQHILTDRQLQQFRDLAAEQSPQMQALAEMRFPLIMAFHLQLDGQLPDGSEGLNRDAVIDYVGEIFALDAAMSLRRAEVMAQVARSLTEDQRAYLSAMDFGNSDSWPDIDARDQPRTRGDHWLHSIAYNTYASEFFSWTAGSVDADTYFCPERHGTYFGGFYLKDMPAMGQRDYDISTSITGDTGRAFLEEVLTPEQRSHITEILDLQRPALNEVAEVRRAVALELRKLLGGETPDRDEVIALGRRYGELDGEMSWYYATAFARVNATLTEEQRPALMELRALEGYECAPAYIYSRPIRDLPAMPETDVLLFQPEQEQPGPNQ